MAVEEGAVQVSMANNSCSGGDIAEWCVVSCIMTACSVVFMNAESQLMHCSRV